jgi:hypothetical protein
MARRGRAAPQTTTQGEVIKEESSWRYPLTIFLITLLLSALFLYVYVGPGVDDLQGATPKPTVSDERTIITVGDLSLSVPASHTIYPRDRRPGERDALPLYASWPRMEGYTPGRKTDFAENKPNSRRIDIVIERKNSPFSETERLEVLYLPQTVDRRGVPFDHGLTQYGFRQGSATRPASGYADKEMLIGEASDGARAVLFCYRETQDQIVPPDCFRQYDVTPRVTVKYYFKKPYLPEWRKIDERVRAFVEELAQPVG